MSDWTIRPLYIAFGEKREGHAHWMDHLTVVVKGPVRIDWRDPDGTTGSVVLDRGDSLHIPAPRYHTFTALHERGAGWRCIFKYDGTVDREYFDRDKP
jgi:cupin superfamily acireductone dioxygenase involved in methionine salvage